MSDFNFTWKEFCAGWMGGVCGLVFGHPFDTIKVRQQLLRSTIMNAIAITYRHEGIRGFYKGMLFPFLTVGLNNAVFFGTYSNTLHYIKPKLNEYDKFNRPNDWQQYVFLAASFAGIFQVLVTNPVEIIKIRLQANMGPKQVGNYAGPTETNITQTIKKIYESRGIKGFYHGTLIMMLRDVPTSGIYILTYIRVNEELQNYNVSTFVRQSLAGGIAGIMSWLPVVPLDVIKSRLQADSHKNPKYKGIWNCMISIYRTEGMKTFTRGLTLSLVRAFPTSSAIFVGYEQFLALLDKL